VVACLAVLWPAGCRDRERVPAEPGADSGRERSRRPGLPVLACLAVPWPAGFRDRERLPAEPGAATGRERSRRPNLPDLTGRRLAAMIAIGRHREGLSSFTDRGAWLHGVGRGPVVVCLAVPWPAGCWDRERVPAEPGAATGRWRSRRRVCPSCPAGSGDDRHRAPPGTAVEFHRSRRLASRVARGRVLGGALAGGLPGSRATASGTRRRCRQGAIETPSLPELRGRLWRFSPSGAPGNGC